MYLRFSIMQLICALLAITTPLSHAALKSIAISGFEFDGDAAYRSQVPSFEIMLRTELVKTRRFRVLERAQIDKVLDEQGLTETGLIGANAKKLGGLLGADYLLYGTITEATDEGKSRGKDRQFRMSIDLSVVDAATGEIKTAESIDAADYGTFKQVMRELGNQLVEKVVLAISPITIASVKLDSVVLNYGRDIVANGSFYDVFTQGEAILDPATGDLLGREEEKVGQIKVTAALAKFSKAEIMAQDGDFETGMICRPATARASTPRPGPSPRPGKLRIAVGEFRYSREFDMQQTTDRTRPGPIKGAGGWLKKTWEANTSDSFPTRRETEQVADSDQTATAMSKRSVVLRDMVTTRLVKSGKFDVFERSRLEAIKDETRHDSDGDFDETTFERGKLMGADYVVVGAIVKFKRGLENKDDWGGTRNTADLTLTVALRILDVKTGKIKIADNAEGKMSTTKQSKSVFGFGTNKEDGGALGDLMSVTADAIVSKVATTLMPIKIIDVVPDTGVLMLSYGEGFVKRDDWYRVFSQGEPVRDPDTGEVIARREKMVGYITISETTSRFSKATVYEDSDPTKIKTGMVCRLAEKPPRRGPRTSPTLSPSKPKRPF